MTGLKLGANEYIDTFSIDTWGVVFRQVCHFPPGWTLTVGRSASPDGTLAGQGSHGVTFLNATNLDQLHGLVLVSLDIPIQRTEKTDATGTRPATFSGTVHVGAYGTGDTPERKIAIGLGQIRLAPANACPPPKR